MTSNSAPASKTVLRRKKSSLSDIRVTLLGDRDVGKSGELVHACRFLCRQKARSDTRYKHEMMVDSDTVLFEILDSSSPITLNIKRFNFASHFTDLFLVVYSITDRNSFTYVRNLLKHLVLLKESGMQIPLVAVVGNKSDMAHLRQVTTDEGSILCSEYSELVVNFFGEISVSEQLVSGLFSNIYRWVKKQKIVAKSGQSIQERLNSGKGSPSGSPPV